MKNVLENVAKERDKYLADSQEAQKRAAEVAIEIDEQNNQNNKEREEEIKVRNQFIPAFF